MTVKIKVESSDSNQPYLIEIGETQECFKKVTVNELKTKLWKIESLRTLLNETQLQFSGVVLENNGKSLSSYGIKENSLLSFQKLYDKDKHFGIKFVQKDDAITGDNDPTILRAELSCGHAVDPNSLTGWCRSLIDAGKYEFYCPAITDGKVKQCEKKLPYVEIRSLALLNEAEMTSFEKKLSENAAASFFDYKECPNCRSFVERKELGNLRVTCTVCPIIKKKSYEFCWQCENEWTVPLVKATDTCGRNNCVNKNLKVLADCKYIKLENCADEMPFIPSIRACITCGFLCEHNGKKCKNIICPRCNVEFCFACLETKQNCLKAKPSSWFETCAKAVAPIQIKIPIWNRF